MSAPLVRRSYLVDVPEEMTVLIDGKRYRNLGMSGPWYDEAVLAGDGDERLRLPAHTEVEWIEWVRSTDLLAEFVVDCAVDCIEGS